MTRTQIDGVEEPAPARSGISARPRDAATLVLLDDRADGVRVLMGRRHERHAFMPGKFVFPGGRTDADDSRVAVSSELRPEIAAIFSGIGKTASRARAIALSAVRETYEEAGLLVGTPAGFVSSRSGWQGFVDHRVAPALGGFSYLARAITPPGGVRRFDAHFFTAWRESVAVELPGGGPTQELQELAWLTLAQARRADVPEITRTILGDLEQRLTDDPQLRGSGGIPFYRMVGSRFQRDLMP